MGVVEHGFWRGWSLNLYESAGEAGGSWSAGRGQSPPGEARPDPERAAAEAARRAKAKIRRYCAGNGLNRLGTLTYAGSGCHDPKAIRADLGVFFRRLRDLTGGQAFPYVWVPEWHKSDHGMHAHFAVGQFVARGLIEEAWGHGFVHIKLIGDLPVGSGRHAEARKAGGYLSKYAGKDFDKAKMPGLHRYEVAQGFTPEAVKLYGDDLGDVLGQATKIMGASPSSTWLSQLADGWDGPPVVSAQWA